MDKDQILKKARASEFWNKYLIEQTNLSAASFFGGTSLKNEEGVTIYRVCLNLLDVEAVKALCKKSDVLIYNFYSNTLGILLSYYEEDFIFLSPVNQFDHKRGNNGLFFSQPKINFSGNFKELFSAQKELLQESTEQTLEIDFINEYFGKRGILQKICQFGLIIGENVHTEIKNTVKTLFHIVIAADGPYLEISVRGEMYDAKLLALFADNFNTLLHQLILRIYEPIEDINFRGALESEILASINDVESYFSLDNHIVDLIDLNCEKNKNAIAICHGKDKLTYGELFNSTNQLSRYLSAHFKIERDDLIGIMLPRSINMAKGILSTWKSGAAYVPIGTDLPDENVLQIIENSALKAIITDNKEVLKQLSRLDIQIPIINLNEINTALAQFEASAIQYNIQPNDLAYVIYTSGSTGKPKGVMIEHIGMINHIGAKIREMAIDENSIVAQNAPHTFDISIWQLFSPLVAGGKGIIYDTSFLTDVKSFVEKIATDEVTILELVPSYLLEMLYQLEQQTENIKLALEIIILNAETLTKTTAKRWQALYPQIPIINTYGATEVSDDMSHYFIPEDLDSYSVPVMKKPIQNFEVHIVNEHKKIVPLGVKGEILLAGPCVGRGYINDEEKTKAAFLNGPLAGITSYTRIYKTGDMGKFTADGTMEFIGRNDNQVKILGHRIELDAIENIVSTIEQIKNCKAIAHPDKQLIALYYVSEQKLEKSLIESELLKKLPKYMMPSAYIHMLDFPLTENGKINKKLLPDLEKSDSLDRVAYSAPQNETEITIAAVWSQILGVDSIGISDNFFDLGGHSLKLMRLKNEYHKIFDVKIELKFFFENPTLASHAILIDSSEKKKYKQIKRIKKAPYYALSDAQKRLWILSQFEGGFAVYNMPFQLILKGDFKLENLERAINATIERHEILRTIFKENEAGEVCQWVLDTQELEFKLSYYDFSGIPENQLKVQEEINVDSLKAFNLENGPLFRASLFKINEEEHVFYYNIHHIIGDGWSTEILIKDVMAHIDAYNQGGNVKLPKLRIQYKDYTAWQLTQLEQTLFKKHKDYWSDQFRGILPLLDLPSGLKRPLLKTYNGKSLGTYLSKELTEMLKNFCQENGGSLFMGLLATLNALFFRYTNQDEFIIGSPVAGRDHKELENQIGFYVNTLALKNYVGADESFNNLFLNVKENTLDAYKHQQYPFDRLVDDLELNRDMSRNPLFDVMLVLQNDGEKGRTISADEIDKIGDFGYTLSKFDLMFTFWEVDDLLSLRVDYNTDVYQQEMLESLLQHFKQLLTALLKYPTERLSNVDYLSSVEKQRQLHAFNNTAVAYPQDKTVLDYFSEQVIEKPGNIALVYREEQLTYEELDKRSNQLANYLLSRGVVHEMLIPICLDRSLEMVIAIIGIMRAGGAYVPIDPAYPKERIHYILEDTGASFVLSADKYLDLFDGTELVDLANFKYNLHDSFSLTVKVLPSHLAYCIYTSGTTGKPKGVLNQHSGLLNRLLWMKDDLNINEKSVLLQKTTYVFDVSVWELTMCLITGSKLVIAAPGGHVDPDYLQDIIEKEKVSIIHFVPSMLGLFLEFVNQDKVKSIQHVVCSGEALPSAMVAKFQQKLPGLGIHNLYGPTEAAIDVTMIDLTTLNTQKYGVSIGKPVTNTQLYVVNEMLQVQPVGVTGELLIGGVQVARGYLNRPELTKEKFVKDIFTSDGYLYKTGDLVKWLPDGNIEFLGRKDDQVKIRGQRIELEEIAGHIRLKSGVTEAAVMIRESNNGEKELVAYVVSAKIETSTDLRAYLSERLPEYMLPAYYVQIEQMPLTSNGKVDKRSLPDPEISSVSTGIAYAFPENETEEILMQIWAGVLEQHTNDIGIDAGFFTIGGNSLRIIKLRNEIQKRFNRKVSLVSLFQHATVRLQARMILEENSWNENEATLSVVQSLNANQDTNADIAVIGMSIKAPGQENIEAFWNNLKTGVESLQHYTKEELLANGVTENLLKNEKYIRSGAYLEGKENFDAAFFGYLPDEARLIDPQTRVFHEIVWSALEDAGYNSINYKGLIGLYAGAKTNIKWQAHSMLNSRENGDAFASSYLSDKDYLNSLIAHKLNLKGSVSSINTACSTSLVAIHQAVRSLQSGENDIAVAGGITLRSGLKEGYLYQEGMINSKDGHNRAFDQLSSGTVSGEGAAAVVLKRLDRAITDGDQILAVIKGSAINNDGNRKVGFTAPSIAGQAEVVKMAHRDAGVHADTIGYIEAHGTATKLGDPIEVAALTQVFGGSTLKYCALGTVKTNMGHLDSAAGIVGFIKTVLCLKNKQLVPSLHFNSPNPEIDFEKGPFYVNTEFKEWKSEKGPLRAGVSSFGIGGTNAHIILEEAPRLAPSLVERQPQIITLSAKTKEALTRQEENLKTFLLKNKGINLADLALTLQKGRAEFTHRLSLVADTIDTLLSKLTDKVNAHVSVVKTAKKELVFMFPGQGSQYINMGKELYEQESVFRAIADHCFKIAKGINGLDYKDVLYPVDDQNSGLINETKFTQPILFIFEYALAKQLEHYGLIPDMMIGHSIGEYVSACLSGVITLEEALKLVIKRGELIQALPSGAMLSVALPAEAVKPFLSEQISVAAINTKESCVLSGELDTIGQLAQLLEEKGISFKKLHTSHAFHSNMMTAVEKDFTAFVADIALKEPKIPYISNVTGKRISLETLKNESYWSDHIRKTVKFSDGLEEILTRENIILIEVGPGKTLSDFVRQHQKGNVGYRVLNLIRHPKEETADRFYLLNNLAKLWVYGASLNWSGLHEMANRRMVSLPTYPFEKVAYPLGDDIFKVLSQQLISQNKENRQELSKWFYEPTWKRARLNNPGLSEGCHLIFMDDLGVGEALVNQLKLQNNQVIQISAAKNYVQLSDNKYQINASAYEDYEQLFSDLTRQKIHPANIIHLFNIQVEADSLPHNYHQSYYKNTGFYSVLHIAKNLNNLIGNKPVNLMVVTNDLQPVMGSESSHPLKSLTLGMLNVISQENPLVNSKSIDISLSTSNILISADLIKEINATDSERFIAYRFNNRWIKDYNPIHITQADTNHASSKIKKGGVYLITGGLGNLGFEYAKWLQEQYNAVLILVGRKQFILNEKSPEASRLKELQSAGQVLYYSANNADFKAMQEAIYLAEAELGEINGVIHAAGIIKGSSMRGINFLKTEDCELQFEPKVKGVEVLAELFKDRILDFCLLVSSLSTVLGGKEFASYAAANTYMDYVSQAGLIKNCISINYDGLSFNDGKTDTALIPAEMIEVLENVLSMENIPQVVVSLTDLYQRLERWTKPTASVPVFNKAEEIQNQETEITRENLTTPYSAAETETENRLKQLFETFFAVSGIGTNDDFFDLGGDSLKAMTISNHIYRQFDIELSLKDFYTSPTIKSLAKEIDLALAFKDISKMDVSQKFENETVI